MSMKKLLTISMILLSSNIIQTEQGPQKQPRKHARRYALAPDPKDNYHYNAYRDIPEAPVTETSPSSKKQAPSGGQKNNAPTGTQKRFSLFG